LHEEKNHLVRFSFIRVYKFIEIEMDNQLSEKL
jgi:hypothetical protein